MTANAFRRRTIVEQAKNPKAYITARYKEAKDAIKAYFTSGYREEIIDKCIKALKAIEPESDFQQNDRATSLELLDVVRDTDFPDFDGYKIEPFKGDNTLLSLHGVDISVNPDLVILNEREVGIIKLHTSKNNALTDESSLYIATILHNFASTHLAASGREANREICISYDTFAESLVPAPVSIKRRWSHIEAACKEIALLWDSVE